MATAAELVLLMRAETAAFRRDMQTVRSTVAGVEKGMASMKGAVAGALAGYATFQTAVRFVQAVARETMAAQQSNAKLEATVRATGHAAGVTADELKGMADAMEAGTLFDDSEIKNAMSVLLTFKAVSRDVFGDTMKLAADLSAQGFGDLQSTATQLGKALESPRDGISALTRVGVTFTDQQEAQIKKLVEQNKLLDAQRIILGAVRGQVGGVAEAMNTGLAGALNGLSDQWGDLLKNLGSTATEAGYAERAINTLTDALRKTQSLFGAVDRSNTAALQARADQLRARGGAATGEGWGPDWLRRALGIGGMSQRDMDEINRISEQLMGSTVMAVPPPPAAPKAIDPTAAAAAKAHAEAVERMAESIKIARVEMLEGADAAQLYRLELAKMPRHVIEAARANHELRDTLEREADAWRTVEAAMRPAVEQFDAARNELQELHEELEREAEERQRLFDGIHEGWEAGFRGALDNSIRNFRDFARTVLEIWHGTLAQIAAERAAGGIMSLIGGVLGSAFGPKGTTLPAEAGTIASAGSGGAIAPSVAPNVTVHLTLASLDPRTHADLLMQQVSTIKAAVAEGVRRDRGFAQFLGAVR
jgi:hypothetical protein